MFIQSLIAFGAVYPIAAYDQNISIHTAAVQDRGETIIHRALKKISNDLHNNARCYDVNANGDGRLLTDRGERGLAIQGLANRAGNTVRTAQSHTPLSYLLQRDSTVLGYFQEDDVYTQTHNYDSSTLCAVFASRYYKTLLQNSGFVRTDQLKDCGIITSNTLADLKLENSIKMVAPFTATNWFNALPSDTFRYDENTNMLYSGEMYSDIEGEILPSVLACTLAPSNNR